MKAFLILLVLEGIAIAQPRSPQALYQEGQDAYDRGDNTAAVLAWQAAYDASHAEGLLFNLAQAQRLANDCSGALETYRKFLATKESEQHALARDWERELEVTCSSSAPVSTTVTRATAPIVTSARATPARSGDSWKTAGLVTGGTGLVVLAVGLGIGHHGSSIGNDVTAECQQGCDWASVKDDHARGQRYTSIGTAFDIAGGLAIGGGLLFYYLGVREDDALTVTPTPGREGAVLSWSGSW